MGNHLRKKVTTRAKEKRLIRISLKNALRTRARQKTTESKSDTEPGFVLSGPIKMSVLRKRVREYLYVTGRAPETPTMEKASTSAANAEAKSLVTTAAKESLEDLEKTNETPS